MIAALLAAAAAATLPGSVEATAPASPVVVVPAGTEIELMVVREVDSDRAQPGDPVKLRVNRPVMVGTAVVVPVGTGAAGAVVASRKSGTGMRRGALEVRIDTLDLGGREVALGGMLEQRGRGGEHDDFLKIALAPMWAPFARGNSAKLKAGELLTATVETTLCFTADRAGHTPVQCPAGTS